MKIKYFLSILILFLINIVPIKALEVNFSELSVEGYNNNGNSLTAPSYFNCNETGSCGMEITTNANSYGGAWGIQSPIPLLKNNNYSISIRIRSSYSPVVLSSKFYLALGNSHANAKANYENATYWNTLKYYKSAGNSVLQYVFTADTNASYIVIPFTTVATMTGSFMIDNIIIEDLGSQSLTQDQINNVINNQTSIIQSDINNLQNEFNNTINDTFTTCEPQKNLFNSSTITNGDISGAFPEIRKSSRQVLWLDAGTYTFSTNLTTPYQYVIQINDISPAPTNGYPNYILDTSWINNNRTFTINKGGWFVLGVRKNDNSSFNLSDIMNFNYQLEKGSSVTSYSPYEEVCKNKLDSLNDTQKETNDKLDDLNDNITNNDSSGATGEAENFFSNFNTDTFGLTSVITAPLELIKSVTSKSCTPLHGTLPFVNSEVNLPCLSTIYESHFGSFLTIYRTITFGFVSYWVCIKIFNLVKDFKNPEHDEIEVLDL